MEHLRVEKRKNKKIKQTQMQLESNCDFSRAQVVTFNVNVWLSVSDWLHMSVSVYIKGEQVTDTNQR